MGPRFLCTGHVLSGNEFSFVFHNPVRQHPCPFLHLQPFADGLVLGVFRKEVDEVEHGGVIAVWGVEHAGGIFSGEGRRFSFRTRARMPFGLNRRKRSSSPKYSSSKKRAPFSIQSPMDTLSSRSSLADNQRSTSFKLLKRVSTTGSHKNAIVISLGHRRPFSGRAG